MRDFDSLQMKGVSWAPNYGGISISLRGQALGLQACIHATSKTEVIKLHDRYRIENADFQYGGLYTF